MTDTTTAVDEPIESLSYTDRGVDQSEPGRGPFVLGVILFVALTVFAGPVVFDGELGDTDAYSWANRVTELRTDGDWFDESTQRVTPPEGHEAHWSRPFDTLLLVGAVALEPFVGFEDALFAWAVVLPVLLGLLTFAILWRTFSGVLDESGRLALAIFFGTNSALIAYFRFGRADHQALIGVVVAALLAKSWRMLRSGEITLADALTFGAIAGLGLWGTIETVITVATTFISLSLAWVLTRQMPLVRLAQATAAWAAVSALALLAENGSDWNHRRFDELSLAGVVLAALLAAGFVAMELVDRRRPLRSVWVRMAVGAAMALTAAAMLFVFFPGLREGAEGDVDPLYRATRLSRLAEGRSIFDEGFGATLGLFAFVLTALPVAAIGVYRLVRRPRLRDIVPWLPLLITAAVYTAYTVWQVRWAGTAAVPLVVLAAIAVRDLWPRIVTIPIVLMVTAAAVWWIPVLLIWPPAERVNINTSCDVKVAAGVLGDEQGFGAEAGLVLANADAGPELVYRTPHSVFSIPNHRFQPAYTRAYEIMTATDIDEARERFDASGADYMLVCAPYAIEWTVDDPAALINRISRGDSVPWLEPIALPDEAGELQLYRRGNP